MDKVIGKIKNVRFNWWEAFKQGVKLNGYEYYKPPKEIKYRYPAPGSVPLDKRSKPNLFKKDFKLPYKDSLYNIRAKDIGESTQYEDYFYGEKHELNPEHPRHKIVMDGPTIDRRINAPEQTVVDRKAKFGGRTRSEKAQEYREQFQAQRERQEWFCEDKVNGIDPDMDHIYNQTFIKFNKRGANPLVNEKRLQKMYIEIQDILENDFNGDRIESKQMNMYKGKAKKWQVLDDQAFSRDQIEKLQTAIKAPTADEMEAWAEQDDTPMTLPITNQNVSEWRDKKRAIDSADFNAKLVDFEKNTRGPKNFMKRYERPKELAE